jgi:hypothetical protein
MSWKQGSYPYTWTRGSGVRRKTIAGPCPWLLTDGATHMQEFNWYENFMGILYDVVPGYVQIDWVGSSLVGEPPSAGNFASTHNKGYFQPEVGRELYERCWAEADDPTKYPADPNDISQSEGETEGETEGEVTGTDTFINQSISPFLLYTAGGIITLIALAYYLFKK